MVALVPAPDLNDHIAELHGQGLSCPRTDPGPSDPAGKLGSPSGIAWAVRSPTGDLFLSHGQRFSTKEELTRYFATLRAFERERGYPHGR